MTRLTDEEEARALLARRIDELIALGFDGLRARLGARTHSWLGGRLQVFEGGADDAEEIRAPSGALYQLEIGIEDWPDEITVSVELSEYADPRPPALADGFVMRADGAVARDPDGQTGA